jgi:hypothetical protein
MHITHIDGETRLYVALLIILCAGVLALLLNQLGRWKTWGAELTCPNCGYHGVLRDTRTPGVIRYGCCNCQHDWEKPAD